MQYNRKAFSEDYTTETFYFPLSVQVEDEDSEDLYNVSSDSVRWFEDEIQETILENKTLTLQYIFSEFLQGPMGRPQTGLKGYIMRLILDELAPDSKIDLDADGQEYFSQLIMGKGGEVIGVFRHIVHTKPLKDQSTQFLFGNIRRINQAGTDIDIAIFFFFRHNGYIFQSFF